MSVASSAPGWGPGVAQIGSCVCPCRSVRQVRLKLIRVGGVGYRHPMLARLLDGWVVLLRGPGVQGSWGTDGSRRSVSSTCPAVAPVVLGPASSDTSAAKGVLRFWCSSCSARAAPLSDRPPHTRCRRESSSILNQRLRPGRAATPAAPLPLEPIAPRRERSLPQPGPRTRGAVALSRR